MAENKNNSLPVERLYEGRRNFSIIGLTGMAGSGCSTLAQYMSSKSFLDLVRKPEDIHPADFPQSLVCTLLHGIPSSPAGPPDQA